MDGWLAHPVTAFWPVSSEIFPLHCLPSHEIQENSGLSALVALGSTIQCYIWFYNTVCKRYPLMVLLPNPYPSFSIATTTISGKTAHKTAGWENNWSWRTLPDPIIFMIYCSVKFLLTTKNLSSYALKKNFLHILTVYSKNSMMSSIYSNWTENTVFRVHSQ